MVWNFCTLCEEKRKGKVCKRGSWMMKYMQAPCIFPPAMCKGKIFLRIFDTVWNTMHTKIWYSQVARCMVQFLHFIKVVNNAIRQIMQNKYSMPITNLCCKIFIYYEIHILWTQHTPFSLPYLNNTTVLFVLIYQM